MLYAIGIDYMPIERVSDGIGLVRSNLTFPGSPGEGVRNSSVLCRAATKGC